MNIFICVETRQTNFTLAAHLLDSSGSRCLDVRKTENNHELSRENGRGQRAFYFDGTGIQSVPIRNQWNETRSCPEKNMRRIREHGARHIHPARSITGAFFQFPLFFMSSP